jgi:hypothetical protein
MDAMELETLFLLSNLLVMPFWLLMILLPGWRWTRRIMQSPLVIAPPALVYVALILPNLGDILPAVLNPSLDGLIAFLSVPQAAFAGWMHYLAFDLFVGRWAYLDSRERAISAWLMVPVLFFTLMLGPIGFLLYLALRAGYRQAPA